MTGYKTGVIIIVLSILTLSGCVAMQDDVATLQERVVRGEGKIDILEKETFESRSTFEREWSLKLADLSENILILRERIAGTEGSINTLMEQIKQESEKSERFRTSTSQELIDFQKGMFARLDMVQSELDILKKSQTEISRSVQEIRKGVEEIDKESDVLSDRMAQVDTELFHFKEESAKKLAVIVEEISKENTSLRQRISEIEKKISGKTTSKTPSKTTTPKKTKK